MFDVSNPPSPSPQSYSSNFPVPPTPPPPPPSGYSRPPFVNLSAPPTAANVAVGIGFGLLPFIVEAAFPAIAIVGLPVVAGAFVSFATFVIACAAGLLPTSICPRPDNPSPGGRSEDFKGGQCCDHYYDVYGIVYFPDLPSSRNETKIGQILLGKVIGIVKSASPDANGQTQYALRMQLCNGTFYDTGLLSISDTTGVDVRVTRVVDLSGADSCGNPPPQPQPQRMPEQISNLANGGSNTTGGSPSVGPNPKPPSPLPRKAPPPSKIPSPQPEGKLTGSGSVPGGLGSSGGGVNPGGGGNYNDFPDTFSDFPPSPQPNSRYPGGAVAASLPPPPPPVVLSLPPEIPPPLPDKLPPDSTDQDKYIYRQNKETLDKVYRANAEILEIQQEQQKQRKILENIQSLLDIEVQGSQLITRCDDVDIFYSYKAKILTAISQQLNHVKAIEQTIISEICGVESASVVAAPDWWQVRLQGDVPQIALIFRVASTRTYHKITIPHPLNTAKLSKAPIQSYKKGNWQAEIICIDNSKCIVNCNSKEEAVRVLTIAATLIDPLFLGGTVRMHFGERRGVAVSEGNMGATSAMYFPTGQKDTMPEWRVTFRKDGQ